MIYVKTPFYEKNPSLRQEWAERNAPLSPDNYGATSPKKVWWVCPSGHEYEMTIGKRVKGKGCPVCEGLLNPDGTPVPFYKEYPRLLEEWSAEKNLPLTPEECNKDYSHRVWWKCPNGHEDYQASVKIQVQYEIALGCERTRCPVCGDIKRAIRFVSQDYKRSFENSAIHLTPYEEAKEKADKSIADTYSYYRHSSYEELQSFDYNALAPSVEEYEAIIERLYSEANEYIVEGEKDRIDITPFVGAIRETANTVYQSLVPFLEMTYLEYVDYLLEKYGRVKGNYFVSNCDNCEKLVCGNCTPKERQNPKIKRTKDGLYIHHIDEYALPVLSSGLMKELYQLSPEYRNLANNAQCAYRLVYADLLEHLLLHVKIFQEVHDKAVGVGGIYLIATTANGYYRDKPSSSWHSRMYQQIKDRYDEYIVLLALFCFVSARKKLNVDEKRLLSAHDNIPNNTVRESVYNLLKLLKECCDNHSHKANASENASANATKGA